MRVGFCACGGGASPPPGLSRGGGTLVDTRGGGGGRCFNWLVFNVGGKPGITAPGGRTETMLGRTWLGNGGGGTAWITAGGGMLLGGAVGMELAADVDNDADDGNCCCCWLGCECCCSRHEDWG